jgi:hypothetical protein
LHAGDHPPEAMKKKRKNTAMCAAAPKIC